MGARTTPLITGHYYHVYNRGVDRRPTFLSRRDYREAMFGLNYYHFHEPPTRLSLYKKLDAETQQEILANLRNTGQPEVEIIAFCLMPNHFHILVRQEIEGGISTFVRKWMDSYTKYFNARHQRTGVLFQGQFKALLLETTEQLIHVSRYIHINPTVSGIVRADDLGNYPWSSLPQYLSGTPGICDTRPILENFRGRGAYRQFVFNHIDYAKKLDLIKHLTLE